MRNLVEFMNCIQILRVRRGGFSLRLYRVDLWKYISQRKDPVQAGDRCLLN